MDRWSAKKLALLNSLEQARKEGKVDALALPVINLLNSDNRYCTSSSCSGRAMLLEIQKSKKDAKFFWKRHESWKQGELWKAVCSYKGKKSLWLYCQGFIFHVYCMDMDSALSLLKLLRESGLKRAGVISSSAFPVIEFMSNPLIALPISEKGRVLVPEPYIAVLERHCISFLKNNSKKLRGLEQALSSFFKKSTAN